MKNQKHTPGPWTVEKFTRENDWDRMRARVTDGQDTIAQLFDSAFEDRNHANARLIAAAPELLEALEQILEIVNLKMPIGNKSIAYGNMVAAIRKAKGE